MAKDETTPDHMALWNEVCKTDPKHTKHVNARGGFTAINSMYQCQKATERWGQFGETWGIKDLRYEFHGDSVVLSGTFWYPEGEFPYIVDDEFKPGDDTMKKLQTEIQSKSLSKLGFNADIFLGEWDDNKHAQVDRKAAAPRATPPAPASTDVGGFVNDLKASFNTPDPNRPATPPPGGGKAISDGTIKFMRGVEDRAMNNGWTADLIGRALAMCGVEHHSDLTYAQKDWLCGRHPDRDGKTYKDLPEMKGLFEEAPPAELTGAGRPTEREEPIDVGYGQDDDIPF